VKKKIEEQSFEQALAGLEGIVAAMEKGDIQLAELVAKYDEASKLLGRCRKCLDDAQLTIARLKENGESVETPPMDLSKNDDDAQG
jgi:exodeoxyribonuclease VII small subunit